MFRVAQPAPPKFPVEDLNMILPANQKRPYDAIQILSRLTDNSEFMEYRPDYGREVFTGIAKIDGFPVAFIGNRQGVFPGYPEYANGAYPAVGGKHYRQGSSSRGNSSPFAAVITCPSSGCRTPPASTWVTWPKRRSCWLLASPWSTPSSRPSSP